MKLDFLVIYINVLKHNCTLKHHENLIYLFDGTKLLWILEQFNKSGG